jgi:hypothetical protein
VGCEPVQGIAVAGEQLAYDFGVDDRGSGGDAGNGVGELLDVADAFLEQVARSDAVAAVVQQFLGEGLLDVLAEDEDRESGLLGLESAGSPQPLVRLTGWHTDVGDDQVRPAFPGRGEQGRVVAHCGEDLVAEVLDPGRRSRARAGRPRHRERPPA